MLIDTHSHLNFSAYKKDLEDIISRTLSENVWIINIGSKYESSKKAVEIAERYKEGVYAVVGLHPIHVTQGLIKIKTDPEEGNFKTEGEDFDFKKYKKLAQSKKVVAIGEIGLDYYYRPKTKTKIEQFKNKQKEIFLKQLGLAQELNLPLVLHCRMAHEELLEILKEFHLIAKQLQGAKRLVRALNPKFQGVIHCFTGNLKQAEGYIQLGFCIGLNGIIFKLNLDDVIKNIPLERILIETDCPYLIPPLARRSPEGEDGREQIERNEPIFVKYIAQGVARIKEVALEKVSEITTKNARDLFKI